MFALYSLFAARSEDRAWGAIVPAVGTAKRRRCPGKVIETFAGYRRDAPSCHTDPGYLQSVARDGAAAARPVARQTLRTRRACSWRRGGRDPLTQVNVQASWACRSLFSHKLSRRQLRSASR